MDYFIAHFRRLRVLLDAFLDPEITAVLLPMARPALRLGTGDGVPVRLGGAPLLPPDEPWPEWNGRPLGYLGSIDFSGFACFGEIPGLPASTTAFYYATDTPRPWGDEAAQRDGWRLFTGNLQTATPKTSPYPETTLAASPYLSLPSPQEPAVQRVETIYSGILPVYAQLHAAWTRHMWPENAPLHQVGGWPALVQRPVGPDCLYASTGRPLDSPKAPTLTPEEQRTAEEWRLLLQLDSDPRLGWYWGDPGRVYFCNRENTPLEETWLTLQAA